ncbi:hypothetical protein QQF64_002772 [Cirrhinus molitorella]|uniref:Uncharacterized protein n=1 Tax=Cirrhinus molitorella TaxID=172907 RepID=A0ABR3MR66_9TELE
MPQPEGGEGGPAPEHSMDYFCLVQYCGAWRTQSSTMGTTGENSARIQEEWRRKPTPELSSRKLPDVTQHTGGHRLNAEVVEPRKGIGCRPARSSTDVC